MMIQKITGKRSSTAAVMGRPSHTDRCAEPGVLAARRRCRSARPGGGPPRARAGVQRGAQPGRRVGPAARGGAGRHRGCGAAVAATAASTTVSAASSASVGSPRTTRNSARRSSGVDRPRHPRHPGRRSQRDVPVLAGRRGLALGGQQAQRPPDVAAGVRGRDHPVDVAAVGGDVRVGQRVLVLLLQLGPLARPARRPPARPAPCGTGCSPRRPRPSPRSARSARPR